MWLLVFFVAIFNGAAPWPLFGHDYRLEYRLGGDTEVWHLIGWCAGENCVQAGEAAIHTNPFNLLDGQRVCWRIVTHED